MYRHIPLFPTVLLAVLVLSACAPQGAVAPSPEPAVLVGDAVSDGMPVPVAPAPKLDGSMEPGEWDGAVSSAFTDGSEMLLMCGDGSLYVGIRGYGQEMIAGNVYVSTGAEVAILHTSAALGTARYQQATAGWDQFQDFVWRCRRSDDGSAAQAERERFWESERWLAANSRMGTANELEYSIELEDEGLRMAASVLRSSEPDRKSGWPADVQDDVITPTPGGLPDNLNLDVASWAKLDLSACGEG